MEDSCAIVLLRLCQELAVINEIPANLSFLCSNERMKHEVYKFHLGVDSDLDLEALKSLCEDFRNCYLVFVMSIKEKLRPVTGLLRSLGEEYLARVLKETTKFIEDIASDMESKTKLVNVGKLCEVIDSSDQLLMSLKEYIAKIIEAEVEQMKSAIEDLESENDEIVAFCYKHLQF